MKHNEIKCCGCSFKFQLRASSEIKNISVTRQRAAASKKTFLTLPNGWVVCRSAGSRWFNVEYNTKEICADEQY